MIVLGMAGHVDHGKTALVKALTGIDTDRLPEEKARGMTTDLGFASMRLVPGPIDFGLIDVPGHERYIRNMVAGAWALDLALLVVAADDGWMEQTENHARVLSALGPPRVMPVLTKIDLADPAEIAAMEEKVRNRASIVLGEACLARIQAVSVLDGRGMDALRSALREEGSRILAARGPAADKGGRGGDPPVPPYLYVDRVFTRTGAGTVVCGTFAGGGLPAREGLAANEGFAAYEGFAAGDEVIFLPSGQSARIKSMESLGRRLERVRDKARLAINLAKGRVEPARGDLVAPLAFASAFDSASEFIIALEALASSKPVRLGEKRDSVLERGGEVEVAVGSASKIGRIAPLGPAGVYRLILEKPLALPDGLPLALIRHGGAEVLGRAWVLAPGRTDQARRRKIGAALRGLGCPPGPGLRKKLGEALKEQAAGPKSARTEPDKGVPALSPKAKEAEISLRRAGKAGLDLGALRNAQRGGPPSAPPGHPSRDQIGELCAAGIAIPLDRDIFIHADAYGELLEYTLAGTRPGDSLDIGETKERTGFSRKYVIPFLNRMERDGWVRRDGDRRIVIKAIGRGEKP